MSELRPRLFDICGWLAAAVMALTFVAVIGRAVEGGALDPAAPPASTLRPLDDLAPVWSQALAHNNGSDDCHSSRFICVFSDQAVLDRETGLVWQRVADPAPVVWLASLEACAIATTGGRMGWRLPTEEELRTVMQVALDPAAPFTVNFFGSYWSARTLEDPTTSAWGVLPQGAAARNPSAKTSALRYWCVRGGQAYDGM